MSRPVSTCCMLAMLAACASQPRMASGTDTLPDGATRYRCESGERFAARIEGVSAQILYNGVSYTLPQLSNVAGVQSYADGRHRLEIRQGRTWFGPSGAPLRLCTTQ